jgi:hypothetical protein
VVTPDPDAKPKWIDRQALFFVILIALIGLTSILLPLNFYLFAFNSQSSLPVSAQILWTLAAIGTVLLVARNAIPRIPGWALYIAATLSIVSFVILRTTYPTLIGDGLPPAKGFILHVDMIPRLQGLFCLKLSSLIPHGVDFAYHRSMLFDNQLMSNSTFIVTLVFAIATVVSLLAMVQRVGVLPNSEKVGLLTLLVCSAPMLNGYGDFANYAVPVFVILLWFICLWRLQKNPTSWRLYAAVPFLFVLCVLSHPALWPLPMLLLMMMGLVFLRSRQIIIPLWLINAGAVGLGCAPLILLRSRADPYLATLRFDDTFGLHLHTRLLCCLEVSLPALILAGFVVWRNRETLKQPTPIQATTFVILISSLFLFFTSQIEMAICTNLQYGLYGAMIYGSAIVLYLTTRKDPRPLFYSAILGCFLFVPAAYVHSNSLLLERQLALLPYDRSSTTYQAWGPYLKMGLGAPIDTPENRRHKLDIFKAGATTTIPDWQKFRGLNMIYFTAWCFEFGEYEEGNQCLVQLFDQPQALQALWQKGTQFTIWNENKAYKRIRQASRKIIRESLLRNPANRYLQQLSDLLDTYENKDP